MSKVTKLFNYSAVTHMVFCWLKLISMVGLAIKLNASKPQLNLLLFKSLDSTLLGHPMTEDKSRYNGCCVITEGITQGDYVVFHRF